MCWSLNGPYAEAKEVLTGLYLLEAADLDEAIGWAARIPDGVARQGGAAPVARRVGRFLLLLAGAVAAGAGP